MFFKGSRYEKVPTRETKDASGLHRPRARLIRCVEDNVGVGQRVAEYRVVDPGDRHHAGAMGPCREPRWVGAERVGRRWFGSDDVGAEVGQHSPGHRSGRRGQIDHDDAVEQ